MRLLLSVLVCLSPVVASAQAVLTVTDETFNRQVVQASADKVVALTLEREGCPYCTEQIPLLLTASKRAGKKVLFTRLEVLNSEVAEDFLFSGTPTTFLFYHGKPVIRLRGLQQPDALIGAIARAATETPLMTRTVWNAAQKGDLLVATDNAGTQVSRALLGKHQDFWWVSRADDKTVMEYDQIQFESLVDKVVYRLVPKAALKEVASWEANNPVPPGTLFLPNEQLQALADRHPLAFTKVHYIVYHPREAGTTTGNDIAAALFTVYREFQGPRNREARTALLSHIFVNRHTDANPEDLDFGSLPALPLPETLPPDQQRLLETACSKYDQYKGNPRLSTWSETLSNTDDLLQRLPNDTLRTLMLAHMAVPVVRQYEMERQTEDMIKGMMQQVLPFIIIPSPEPPPPPEPAEPPLQKI